MTHQQPTNGQPSEKGQWARNRGRQVFTGSLWLTAVLSLAIAIGLMVASHYYPIETIKRAVESAEWPLAVWRIGLFWMIIIGWPRWSVIYAAWAGLSGEQLALMLSYRWRMALWLLVMEAVLLHGVVAQFIDNLSR
ncbi:hypothetical protein [Methylotuvimicrobium sp. KM1]|uniref:hypothetical protein n=1 Tax=Methylotuvimicrobium sp. KM1 TaxID=3377707 RepID=UPI00384C2AA5